MASSSKLSHAASVCNTDALALPPDTLFEVLLRLPAKDLYHLHAVCRSWRPLTYDPHFATVHKSHHVEPLFAFTFRDCDGDDQAVAIVGLSGQVLRRIPFGSDGIELLLTHLDRLYAIRMCKPLLAAWVLNPATAVAITLPGPHSDEFVGICIERRFNGGYALWHNCKTVTYAFGQVASTGDYKVLSISHPFFFDYAVMEPASMAPFNLDTKKWMPTLQGPEPLRSTDFAERELSLANLNGSLVIVDNDVSVSFDLWPLVDHKRGLWVKKYRLSIKQLCYLVRPLLILDDGRIVIFEMETLLQCYDPTTGNLVDVLDIGAMGLVESQCIGVYTRSLLI